ncbi:photosystem II cytochrome PsbV2 [Leptolyngbya sp. AN03gr2]|uniref:photosystem II cytochrome PsbV2 n=1 Tax=unclassified Leptolyngbya TaxID=2650499 RepID=UPI003D31D039
MLVQAIRSILIFCVASILWGAVSLPAYARVDPYIRQYLQVSDPVPVAMNDRGEMRSFSYENMLEGKQLFELHCASCHVGGATLPNPPVSLSLEALKQATPPRDTVEQLVAFMRHPMNYDGSDDSLLCREVPESWLKQSEVENLAAFILRAAEKAKGWGSTKL